MRGSGGTVAFEGGITFTVPMLNLEKPRRDQVRFSLQIRGGVRHYAGRWDGEAITGNVSTDAAGKNVVATFELRRRYVSPGRVGLQRLAACWSASSDRPPSPRA